MAKKEKLIQTWVSDDLHKKLREIAKREQRSMANLLRWLIDKALEQK